VSKRGGGGGAENSTIGNIWDPSLPRKAPPVIAKGGAVELGNSGGPGGAASAATRGTTGAAT